MYLGAYFRHFDSRSQVSWSPLRHEVIFAVTRDDGRREKKRKVKAETGILLWGQWAVGGAEQLVDSRLDISYNP